MGMLCLWTAPSREFSSFRRPELQSIYDRELQKEGRPPSELQWVALWPEWVEWVECGDGGDAAALRRAAADAAALAALIQVHADAEQGLDAALAAAQSSTLGSLWARPQAALGCQLRALSLGSSHSRATAERHLLLRLQQRLAALAAADGSGPGGSSNPADSSAQPGSATLWAIEISPERSSRDSSSIGDGNSSSSIHGGAAAPRVLLGVELERGGLLLSGLGRRLSRGQAGGGSTQMRPELALASANLAALPAAAVVLDPCCGSGALLEAAAACGAAFMLGSDVGLAAAAAAASDQLVTDLSRLRLRPGSLDGILCDLPYGYRTAAVVGPSTAAEAPVPAGETAAEGVVELAPPPAEPHSTRGSGDAGGSSSPLWRQLMAALLGLGGQALAPGGRLVAWIPHCPPASYGAKGQGQAEGGASADAPTAAAAAAAAQGPAAAAPCWLVQLGGAAGLGLLHYLPESRQGGFPRVVAVLQRGEALPLGAAAPQRRPRQPQRAQQAQQGTAGGSGAAVDSSAARLQRGMRYKEARSLQQGRDIDVWRASWLGDTAAVQSYLAAGGDPNARDAKGQTPLQFASGYGRAAVAQALLAAGADVGAAADRGGMAPLHRAAARGHAQLVGLLLQAGADPRQRSCAGQTPLMYAAQFGHRGALAALLDPRWHSHGSGGGCAAAAAAAWGDGGSSASAGAGAAESALRSLAEDGWQRLRGYVALTDVKLGLSALHLAAQWGMADAARDLILGPGWDQKQQQQQQQQQQLAVTASGHPEAVVLVQRAAQRRLADPDCLSAGSDGLAPAHLAARWGHVGVLQALQALGADLGLRSQGGSGRTPLEEAQEWRRPACVEFLGGLGQPAPLSNSCLHIATS